MEQKPNPELERVRQIQAELEAAEAEKTLLSRPQGEEDMSLLRHMDMDEDYDDWIINLLEYSMHTNVQHNITYLFAILRLAIINQYM